MPMVIVAHDPTPHGAWPYGTLSGGRRVAFVRDGVVVCVHEIDPAAPLGTVTETDITNRRAVDYRGAPVETLAEKTAREALLTADAARLARCVTAAARYKSYYDTLIAIPVGLRTPAQHDTIALCDLLKKIANTAAD